MKRFATVCSVCAALMLAAGTLAAADNSGIVQALKDLEAQWNKEIAAKDVEKSASHYTEDGTVMGPGMPASMGKAAIRQMFAGMVSDPAFSLKFHPTRVEVSKSGDLAYTQGAYTMTMTDPSTKHVMTDHGSYVTVYKKTADGSWKAVSDIATSELPPSGNSK